MGCGKTSTAKRLANKLGYKFVDMDDMLEQEYHISISDLFEKYDEDAFRKLEQAMLHKTFSLENAVISSGGGTPCFENNMATINDNGISIYLQMSPKMLLDRLENSKKTRPLLQNIKKENRLEFIRDLLEIREKYYQQAKYIIEGKDIDINKLTNLLSSV